MKLKDYLDEGLILPDLTAGNKAEVLRELVVPLSTRVPELDADRVYTVLSEREQLGSTGIGDGVAIPHGKLESLDRILLVVGRSLQGVEFSALDFKPCHIFFLVLAPDKVAGLHLRILAHISRLLRERSFRQAFQTADGRDGLWSLLADL